MQTVNKTPRNKKQPTLKRGGMVVGPFHHEETGGPKFQLKDTKDIIEEEGFEFNIPEEITNSKKIYTFTGKNIEIIHEILKIAGLSAFDKVTDVKAGDIVICIKSSWDDTVRTITGTIPEILSAINTSCGCKHIEDGAKVKEHGVDKTASFNPIPTKKTGGKISSKEKIKDWMIENPNSPRWQKKKKSIVELSNNIRKLKLSLSKDLKSDDEKTFLTALVIAVMMETAERVGNENSAREGHVGVTGFLKKHVNVVGNKVLLEYQGKSGVDHEKSFSNEKIARAIKKAIKNSTSKYLFETSDGFRIKVDKVNRYLSDFNISAKAIRGYCANKWIIEKLQVLPVQETEKKRKKDFNAVVKKVAHRVGHGPATLRKHYMIPELPVEYINHGKIVNIKKMGYFKEGGELGDIDIREYYENENKVPETVSTQMELLELKGSEKESGMSDIFKSCPVKVIEWENVVPTQDFLRSSKFDSLEGKDVYSIFLPWVIEYNNKFYVSDGHHRLVEMKDRNLPIKAHVYSINEEDKDQLKKGIEVEKEHKDLYLEIKNRLNAIGVEMPISEEEFYAEIAQVHINEREDYYDLLEKYVEKYSNNTNMKNEKSSMGAGGYINEGDFIRKVTYREDGDGVKSVTEGYVYEKNGNLVKLKDVYGNKSDKWFELKGFRKIKNNEQKRIDEMVKSWTEQGRAFSNLSDDNTDFLKRIGLNFDEIGITSQTGNDILYYDTKKYASDTDAIKKRTIKESKLLSEGGIIYGDIKNIASKLSTGEMFAKHGLKYVSAFKIKPDAESQYIYLKQSGFEPILFDDGGHYYLFVKTEKNKDEYMLPKYRMNKQGGKAGINQGYYIYLTPKNKNFSPHIWIEGGLFTDKLSAEFQAQQMRKMKQDYNKQVPFYEKVDVVPLATAEKITMSKAGEIPKDSQIIYWTLPKSTPVHKEGTKIVIEKQGEPVKHAHGSYQLWKIYMQSPDGEKYWAQTGLSYEKAMKRGDDLKDTIETGYEIAEILKKQNN